MRQATSKRLLIYFGRGHRPFIRLDEIEVDLAVWVDGGIGHSGGVLIREREDILVRSPDLADVR